MSEEKKNAETKEATQDVAEKQAAPAPGQAPQPQERALFGMIKYKTDEDLDNFLSNLSKKDAIIVLVANARYSIARGCQPEEAEVLSKAMRVLQRPDAKVEEVTDTPESVKEGEPDSEPEKQG